MFSDSQCIEITVTYLDVVLLADDWCCFDTLRLEVSHVCPGYWSTDFLPPKLSALDTVSKVRLSCSFFDLMIFMLKNCPAFTAFFQITLKSWRKPRIRKVEDLGEELGKCPQLHSFPMFKKNKLCKLNFFKLCYILEYLQVLQLFVWLNVVDPTFTATEFPFSPLTIFW